MPWCLSHDYYTKNNCCVCSFVRCNCLRVQNNCNVWCIVHKNSCTKSIWWILSIIAIKNLMQLTKFHLHMTGLHQAQNKYMVVAIVYSLVCRDIYIFLKFLPKNDLAPFFFWFTVYWQRPQVYFEDLYNLFWLLTCLIKHDTKNWVHTHKSIYILKLSCVCTS